MALSPLPLALALLLGGCSPQKEETSGGDDAAEECAAEEIPYDAADNDCDPTTPDDDLDGDGFPLAEDCDDGDALVNPAAPDDSLDGIDQGCDGVDGTDADGDGHASQESGGGDCDDGEAAINPAQPEVCNGLDDDCDGDTDGEDEGVQGAAGWYPDADGDGYGDAGAGAEACDEPAGYVADGADCDDADGGRYPGAAEICGDGRVNDCLGTEADALLQCGLSGTRDLSGADAKLLGESASDLAGGAVAGAGDVNGDGLDDLLIGAEEDDDGGADAGCAYLALGPVSGTLPLAFAAKLIGESTLDNAGGAVAGAGDVDGDGLDDLLIGASEEDDGGTQAGSAYVVLGPVSGRLDLSLADARLVGEESNDNAGYALSGAGDVNGDGLDDLLIGAQGDDDGGSTAGSAYLLLGPVSGTIDLSLADAHLVGEGLGDTAGRAVAGAGDVDGDGLDDLLIGAQGDDEDGSGSGSAYLVLGPVSGTLPLSLADAHFIGEDASDYAGNSVAGAGDVDGDGLDDLLIGAYRDGDAGDKAGSAYLVLGGVSGALDLSLADAHLVGEDSEDYAGGSVAGAGDVDGDGRADLLIGAQGDDEGGTDAGVAYLVRGPVSGTLDLSLADARIIGEEGGDVAASAVAGAGDVDGDGLGDLLLGAPYDKEGATNAGAAYLVRGRGY